MIFRTPGLHPKYLEAARRRGSRITSEMEVFFQVCPCPIIAVTGSDGKTTTTTIIAGLLRAAGRTVHLGGNIGHPLLNEAGNIRREDLAVVELSSFQLMTMDRSPAVAVLTNLAPNHLDVHTDMAEYVAAKANIFAHQGTGDRLVTNWDNDLTRELAEQAPGRVEWFTRDALHVPERGCFLKVGTIWYRDGAESRPVLPLEDILLPGVHNVENYMAAICAVQRLVDDETIRGYARTFGGVEHRIELVRTRRGVRWYNDSIASSPSRTMAGLRAFPEKVILIAGGKDKGVSYAPLGPVINDHVKAMVPVRRHYRGHSPGRPGGGEFPEHPHPGGGGLPRRRGRGGPSGPAGGRGDPLSGQHLLRPLQELRGAGEGIQGPGPGPAGTRDLVWNREKHSPHTLL